MNVQLKNESKTKNSKISEMTTARIVLVVLNILKAIGSTLFIINFYGIDFLPLFFPILILSGISGPVALLWKIAYFDKIAIALMVIESCVLALWLFYLFIYIYLFGFLPILLIIVSITLALLAVSVYTAYFLIKDAVDRKIRRKLRKMDHQNLDFEQNKQTMIIVL